MASGPFRLAPKKLLTEQLAGLQNKITDGSTPSYVPKVGLRIIVVNIRWETPMYLPFKQFCVVWILKAVFTNPDIGQAKAFVHSEESRHAEVH